LSKNTFDHTKTTGSWQLACQTKSTAVFETSPKAHKLLTQIAHFNPQIIGSDQRGFTKIQLDL
jgi:hypothetical protein